nr:MAG TPA: hypothetical protein [Caudoviricetes sp.]
MELIILLGISIIYVIKFILFLICLCLFVSFILIGIAILFIRD